MGRPVSTHIVHYAISVIIANPSLSSPRIPRCLIWNFSRSQFAPCQFNPAKLRESRHENAIASRKRAIHRYLLIKVCVYRYHFDAHYVIVLVTSDYPATLTFTKNYSILGHDFPGATRQASVNFVRIIFRSVSSYFEEVRGMPYREGNVDS